MTAASGWADIVILKSGEKVEGEVLTSTSEKVLILVHVSPTIRDERSIPRADIERMEVVTADGKAFDAIKNLKPGDTALTTAYYDEVIARKIDPFLTDYAYSKYVSDVRKIREAFEKEKARMVNSGEVKFEGVWLTQEDYEKNRMQIDAAVTFEKMQAAAAREDYSQVLNLYDKMQKDYSRSSNYPAAILLAKESADKLDKLTAALLVKLAADEQTREEKILICTPAEQQQVRQAIAQEKAKIDLAIENGKKTGMVYPPLFSNHRDAMVTLQQAAQSLSKNLNGLPVASMQQSVQLTRDAQKNMDAFELPQAERNLEEAKKLWPENGLIAAKEDKLKQRKTELEDANKVQQQAIKRSAP